MHDRVKEAAEKSIKDLQCQYLDLFLMHWPANPSPAATLKTYAAMEDLVSCGLVKAIGEPALAARTTSYSYISS